MRVIDFKARALVYLEGQKARISLLRKGADAAGRNRDSDCYYNQLILLETIISEIDQIDHHSNQK